jgi:2-succinyl-6-hydroxy-2,4-cyclohexadiene-1-carboxylate synthase
MDAAVDPYAYKGLGVDLFDERTEVDGRLGEITCPTTVLAGSKDHPLVDHADAMGKGVANGRVVIIDGAYHSPQLTHRAEWEQALVDHLIWATA